LADDDRLKRIAKSVPDVKPGALRARHIRHFIYFFDRGDHLYVERVLHVSMDETKHFL
jgi:hypothetical protein